MAKTKFSLTAAATFKATVAIPIPGEEKGADIQVTFRHKSRAEFKAFVEGLEGRKQPEVLAEIISGWDLEDELNQENLEKLTDNYLGASEAIITTYIDELTKARRGN